MDEDHAEYVEHRGIKETEAESVVYVAGWADGDPATIKATAARVLRAAHALADALTGSEGVAAADTAAEDTAA